MTGAGRKTGPFFVGACCGCGCGLRSVVAPAGNKPDDRHGPKQKTRRPKTPGLIGRSSKIRTCDPLLPKQVRYQAALYSVRTATSRKVRIGRADPVAMWRLYSCGLFPVQALVTTFYRPCRSCCTARANRVGTGTKLGRRQVVRHRFLVPTFPGSNPGAPARNLLGGCCAPVCAPNWPFKWPLLFP